MKRILSIVTALMLLGVFLIADAGYAIKTVDKLADEGSETPVVTEAATKRVDEAKSKKEDDEFEGGPKGGVVTVQMLAISLNQIQTSLEKGEKINPTLLSGVSQDLSTLAKTSPTVKDFQKGVLDFLREQGITDATLDLFFNTKLATLAENNIIPLAATRVLDEGSFNEEHMKQVENILKAPKGRIVVFVVNADGQADDIIERFAQQGISLKDYIGANLDFVKLAGINVNYSVFEALFDQYGKNIADCTLDKAQDNAIKAALRKG
ncbi:MAG: hypothetical protein KKG01_04390 [Candidatus Omnitrophica bacterium]|nr:hypothetical protein [Candidatus Omnitrophota bacterium]